LSLIAPYEALNPKAKSAGAQPAAPPHRVTDHERQVHASE